MAVMEMKRIGIYARKSDRKRILELLQRKGENLAAQKHLVGGATC